MLFASAIPKLKSAVRTASVSNLVRHPVTKTFQSAINLSSNLLIRGPGHKHQEFALVERGGNARSKHVTNFTQIKDTLAAIVSPEATLYTDQANMYRNLAWASLNTSP
jgi:hypothetical protein